MSRPLHEMSELELLERGLTGWSRFDEGHEDNVSFNDLPTFDRGVMVEKFVEYRRRHPKKTDHGSSYDRRNGAWK